MSIKNEANWLEVSHLALKTKLKGADLSDISKVREIQDAVDAMRRQINILAGDVDLTIAGLMRAEKLKNG